MRSERDCIEQARHLLEAQGVSEATFKALDDEVKARVQDAADFAQSSPEPDEKEPVDRHPGGELSHGRANPDAGVEPHDDGGEAVALAEEGGGRHPGGGRDRGDRDGQGDDGG